MTAKMSPGVTNTRPKITKMSLKIAKMRRSSFGQAKLAKMRPNDGQDEPRGDQHKIHYGRVAKGA